MLMEQNQCKRSTVRFLMATILTPATDSEQTSELLENDLKVAIMNIQKL